MFFWPFINQNVIYFLCTGDSYRLVGTCLMWDIIPCTWYTLLVNDKIKKDKKQLVTAWEEAQGCILFPGSQVFPVGGELVFCNMAIWIAMSVYRLFSPPQKLLDRSPFNFVHTVHSRSSATHFGDILYRYCICGGHWSLFSLVSLNV